MGLRRKNTPDSLKKTVEELLSTKTPQEVVDVLKGTRHRLSLSTVYKIRRERLQPKRPKGGKLLVQLLRFQDMAARLQYSLSRISAKDWAIWGLPDTNNTQLTSEASLIVLEKRGKTLVSLRVEQDNQFSAFIGEMLSVFPEFEDFSRWKESLTDLISLCHSIGREIWRRSEDETGLIVSPIPPMGVDGHLINVPQFIYEFALDHYMTGRTPELEVLAALPKQHKLVPSGLPEYTLAKGSEQRMRQCKQAVEMLAVQYANRPEIGDIKAKEAGVQEESKPFLNALSRVAIASKD